MFRDLACASRSASRGARSSGRCAGSRTAAWCAAGRFVTGFSGEQYALPEAVEQLTHVRKLPRTGERVTVNATDPCNLVGTIVPGPATPSIRTNRVVYVDGLAGPAMT